METKGIMEQVRELLSQGETSAEVIAQGYAPGTVYKVQRQERKAQGNGRLGGRFPVSDIGHSLAPEQEVVQLQEKIAELEAELKAKISEIDARDRQIEEARRQAEGRRWEIQELLADLRRDLAGAKAKAERLRQEGGVAIRDREDARRERDTAIRERDQACAERDKDQQYLQGLRRWLDSREPGWETGFRCFLTQPACTFGATIRHIRYAVEPCEEG